MASYSAIGKQAIELLEKQIADLRAAGKTEEAEKKALQKADLEARQSTEAPEEAASTSPVTLIDRLKRNKGKAALAGTALAGGGLSLLPDEAEEPAAPPEGDRQMAALASPASPTEEKRTLKEALASTLSTPSPRAPKPESLDQLLSTLESKRPTSQTFDPSAFEAERGAAEATFKEDRARADRMALADRLGRAAVQIGAGMQGLKTGADLSGIRGEPLDIGRYDTRAKEDRQAALADVARREAEAKGALEASASREEKAAEETRNILAKDYFNRYQAYKEAQLEAQRAAKELQLLSAKTEGKEESAEAKTKQKQIAAEAKAYAKKTADMRKLDEVLEDMAFAQEKGDRKGLQKAQEQAEALFSNLYTNVEDREKYFKGTKPAGVWEKLTGGTSKIDVGSIRQYNKQNLGQAQRTLDTYNEALQTGTVAEAPEAETTTTDPTIEAYAAQNGLSYEQAKSVLERRGYRGQ